MLATLLISWRSPEWASWSPPTEAVRKLEQTMRAEPFAQVFDCLGRLAAAGHGITILMGNHDVEMTMPPVQDALLKHLQTSPERVRFVDDGRAYRIGGALFEHGNRYDDANINDWSGLRAIASALSRFEEPPNGLEVSSGSKLVATVINRFKESYPFVDLLQPEGELTLLLLAAFEPKLVVKNLDKLYTLWSNKRLAEKNQRGAQPGETRNIASHDQWEPDKELAAAFGDIYEGLCRPRSSAPVGTLGDLAKVLWAARADSLSKLIDDGRDIPAKRLQQLRLIFRRTVDQRDATRGGDTRQYGAAAERIIADSQSVVQTVVMGHTHKARHVGDRMRASYINTGAWADIIRVPAAALEDGADEELSQFLRDLFADRRSDIPPTYADLRIGADGIVSRAQLLEWRG